MPINVSHWLSGLLINAAFGGTAYLLKSVDKAGLAAGICLGTLIYGGFGLPGFVCLALFFVLGTGATRIGRRLKEVRGVAQTKGGRRTTRHVLANGFVAGLCALGAAIYPAQREAFAVAFGGALAAATADTLSSEIGQVFGGTPYLLTTFRRVRVGENGGVTVVGTLAGVFGALVIGLAARQGGFGANPLTFVFAGMVGNFVDSFFGATLERAARMNNAHVNFTCTLAGAGAALFFNGSRMFGFL